jgi:ABC-type dipeptide/oligopeptide/nickel transport system ATPase component
MDLLRLPIPQLRQIRGGRIGMIFQEPAGALNPVWTVGHQIAEALTLRRNLSRRSAREQAAGLLQRVGIPDAAARARAYPHELSGGMQQRAMIAMVLACKPAVLIADEPTTALDVTIQAQILDLLRSLQKETGMSLMLITHDLDLVAGVADDVCVMLGGRLAERAAVDELLTHPHHPYTKAVLGCPPRLHRRGDRLPVVPQCTAASSVVEVRPGHFVAQAANPMEADGGG